MSVVAEKVREAIERGEIPPEFIEEKRVLPATHEAQQQFSSTMQRVYDRILTGTLGEGYSKAENVVEFVLSADKNPNAFITGSGKKPVIVFSTGLLEMCENESELAAVLCHELGHDYFAKIIGASRDVGKLEELGADLRAPLMLRKANYPQDALRKMMEKFPDDDVFNRVFKAWKDEHPLKANRISALEAVERGIVRASGMGMGEQKAGDIIDGPIAADLKSSARRAEAGFTGYMDKLLAAKGYEAASVEGKMSILENVIRDELPKTDAYYQSRIADIGERLGELKLNRANPSHREGVRKLVDAMINHGADGAVRDLNREGKVAESLYLPLQEAYYSESPHKSFRPEFKPMGVFEDLDSAMNRFTKAGTLQEAKSSAAQINRLAESIAFGTDRTKILGRSYAKEIQNKVDLPGFESPGFKELKTVSSTAPMKPSWDRLAELAAESKDPEILTALARMGISEDPRIAELIKTRPAVSMLSRPMGYMGHELRFNERGHIIGLEAVSSDAKIINALALEEKAIAERAAQERVILQNTDWSELRKDFTGFVDKHKAEITPHLGQTGGESPFAEEFVKQCKMMLQENPDQYRRDILRAENPNKYREQISGFFATAEHPATEWQKSWRTASRLEKLVEAQSEIAKKQEKGGYFTGEWGVAPNHPYTQFVVKDESGLFSPVQKLEYLKHTRLVEMDPRKAATPEARWLINNEDIFKGLPKKNLAELETWLQDIPKSLPEEMRGEFRGFKPLASVIHYEVYRTLSETREPLDVEAIHRIRDLASFHSDADSVINKALRERVNGLTADALKGVKPAQDAAKMIDEFGMLAAERSGATYLPSIFSEHPELRANYQQAIEASVSKVTAPEEKAALLEKLLFEKKYETAHFPLLERVAPQAMDMTDFEKSIPIKPIAYEGSIVDPAFKEWTANEYATAIAHSLGKDDGSKEYADRFRMTINRIVEEAPPANARNILERLGKRTLGNVMQLQDELAGVIGKEVERTKPRQAVQYNFHAAVGETALETLGRDYRTRETAIDFLTEPFNKANAEKLIDTIEAQARSKSEEGAKLLAEGMSREAKIEQMQLLHKNFWNLPFEARTLAAEQILFKEVEHGANEAGEIDRSVSYVLDKVMPKAATGTASAETQAGRNVIESYLEATKNLKDKRLITSAMLVANEPNGSFAGKLSMGKGLGLVLDALGPAGKKLKQAIESHPDTPAELKLEFKDSKTMAVDPQRSDVLQWVAESNKNIPEEQRLVKTGEVLGAGSYGITVEGWRADGKKIARTILYPNVRESAEEEFKILREAVPILVKKDPRFAPVADMVRQADKMSLIETNMETAAKQAEVAKKLYNGMEVTVDGQKYTFGTAEYLGHGVNHKDFEVVEGLHFNDLAREAVTAEQKAHVRGLAKAQVTAEIYNLLAGKPFDHDVHGGQQKIIGNHIVRFDHGAQSIHVASARENQMIGHVLGGTIKQHYIKEVPIQEAMAREIERVAQTPAEKDFLRSVQRGVLALGNFQSQMGEEDLNKVIGAVFASGKLDPGIKKAMEERLGMISGRVFGELEKAGKASGISFNAVEHTFEASLDKSPLRPPPEESVLDKIPLKDHHIQAAGGTVAAFAGFGMLVHANHRIDEKKKKGEEITVLDRAEQVGGGVVGTAGTAAAIDGTAFRGSSAKSIGKFTNRLFYEEVQEGLESASRVKFKGKNAIVAGAIAVGSGTLLYLVSKKKGKDDATWVEVVKKPADGQQQSAGV